MSELQVHGPLTFRAPPYQDIFISSQEVSRQIKRLIWLCQCCVLSKKVPPPICCIPVAYVCNGKSVLTTLFLAPHRGFPFR